MKRMAFDKDAKGTGVALIIWLTAGIIGGASQANAQSDFQWTFNDDGGIDYILTSVSDSKVFDGTLPQDDPTINLIVGKRYEVTIVNPTQHPFQVLANGGSAGNDVVLLAQGATAGSLEGDSGINWDDSGTGTVTFTVTDTLVTEMQQGGRDPGYRCGVHVSSMRGLFEVFGTGTPIADPIPETIPDGTIQIALETFATGFSSPISMQSAADGRVFVYDQAGSVTLFNSVSRGATGTTFLDVSDRLVSLGITAIGGFDERGLIGFALHPDFATNGKVYTYTSEPTTSGTPDFTANFTLGESPDHHSVIAEWQVDSGNPNIIDPTTRRELLRFEEPQFNHDGGTIQFGPDNMLYFSSGDGGGADDQNGQDFIEGSVVDGHGENGNGQNKNNIWGTILRIDPDGSNSANGQYGIPGDNPFVGTDGLDETFAWGLRNPFFFSFDSQDGTLYCGDVGQNDIEELDIITSGGNYGWRLKEGTFFFDPAGTAQGSGTVVDSPVEPIPSGVIDPIAEYDHDEGTTIIGGFVYRGSAIPDLVGKYVFADFTGRLFYVDLSTNEIFTLLDESNNPITSSGFIKGFGQDPNGELFFFSSGNTPFEGGEMIKIVPPPTNVNNWTFF